MDSGTGQIDQRRQPGINDLPARRRYADDGRAYAGRNRLRHVHFRQAEVDLAVGQAHLPGTAISAPVQDAEARFCMTIVADVAKEYQVGRFELYVYLSHRVRAGLCFARTLSGRALFSKRHGILEIRIPNHLLPFRQHVREMIGVKLGQCLVTVFAQRGQFVSHLNLGTS